ncbi:MAG: histidine phosphatase family protein [Ignavibacteria bacterium]|nr:histidine phosphatase family protein [Ignavibacteria bacterium]MBT8382251.1 histidine phosphatase family protein [Ignavibacteria bacterium]MBT8390745.1 histidine phosphatase family protein [Ignavibacteria bacterium]NNJ53414.1 histidine phosphatase family protein [Ignavibacteriaceae bacterium]NNL22411.1 histidine phosphatase family protein [Ignavibacteriaceae bacterium]
MKTLYLVRHAKSSWKDSSLDDIERPLNKRGKRDAPFMGELLSEKGIKPNVMFSSPAKRASKTAQAIAEQIGYPKNDIIFDEAIYEASSRELVDFIKKIDDQYNSVMIFGHNPGFTMLNNFLSKEYIDNLPTCGVIALEFNSSWKDIDKNSAKVLFFDYPKRYM